MNVPTLKPCWGVFWCCFASRYFPVHSGCFISARGQAAMLAFSLHSEHILDMWKTADCYYEILTFIREHLNSLVKLSLFCTFNTLRLLFILCCSSEDKALMVVKDPIFLRPPPPCQPPVNRTKCLE